MAATDTPPHATFDWKYPLLLLILACAAGAFVIEPQSFWIDEANTALHAVQPTLPAWRDSLHRAGSDAQMPIYMFYTWVWEKISGPGEWQLRLSNLPWLVLALLAIPRQQTSFRVVFLVSPFVWYYLDELRPYLMQIGAAMLILGSIWRLMALHEQPGSSTRENRLAAFFCLGLVLLSGSSLLGMIWGAAMVAMFAMLFTGIRTVQLARKNLPFVLPVAFLLCLLALYYCWTIQQGCGATAGTTNIQSTVFSFYEMMGLAGLGPGRTQLHAEGVAPLRPYIPLLAVHAMVTFCVLILGAKHVFQKTPRRVWSSALMVLGSTTVLLLILGILKNFRVLGRHFSPLEPVLLWVLAVGVRESWLRGGYWKIIAASFIIFCLASGLELRFASRHAKDDYRDAAAIAMAASQQGKQVWWCADANAGRFYRVPLAPWPQPSAPGQVREVINQPLDTGKLLISNKTPPDLIALSKPEIYDQRGALRTYLRDHHYQLLQTLPAFTFWRKPE